jgi:hypothetical protein
VVVLESSNDHENEDDITFQAVHIPKYPNDCLPGYSVLTVVPIQEDYDIEAGIVNTVFETAPFEGRNGYPNIHPVFATDRM